MHTYSFEKLEVWQRARLLTGKIYKLTADFPESEKFGLISQLRRASVSVCSNISEGSSRYSCKDQRHFYNMAYSSLMETLNQIIISYDLQYIEDSQLQDLRESVQIISLLLNKLYNSFK